MPSRKVSQDLKDRIPVLYHQQNYTVKNICELLGIKKTLVYQTLLYYAAHGVAFNRHAQKRGRPRKLGLNDIKFINSLVQQRHCVYLDEIQRELEESRDQEVSITTIYRTLCRLNYTRKKVSARALERNELQRNAYMNKIAEVVTNLDQLMFVDEAARNRRTSTRMNGWALLGRKCVQRRFFVRGERFSILPILTIEGEHWLFLWLLIAESHFQEPFGRHRDT